MWYTGDVEGVPPPPPCTECTGGTTPANTSCSAGAAATGPTFLTWAHSPNGPWSTPQRLFKTQANQTNMDTNLAAAILADGSVVGIGRTGGGPTGIIAHLVTARHWREPASYVGSWSKMLFPNTTIVPNAGVEDPFVWCVARLLPSQVLAQCTPRRVSSRRTASHPIHIPPLRPHRTPSYRYDAGRRVFHAVFHNQIEQDDQRLCGAHAYSTDGRTWTFGGTAWSNRVSFEHRHDQHAHQREGEHAHGRAHATRSYRFSRRERPHLLFDVHGAIVALTTGVQYGPHAPTYHKGEDACYTLLQPVRRAKTSALHGAP
jgi:hypothetical protein